MQLTKTIALIELFRNGLGSAADDETLFASLPEQPEEHILTALDELRKGCRLSLIANTWERGGYLLEVTLI